MQVDRPALPAVDWSLKVKRPYLPPQSRLEVEVQLIWQAVLNKKERISCDADFSDIGGNMMHAVIANGIVRSVASLLLPFKPFEHAMPCNASEWWMIRIIGAGISGCIMRFEEF